MTTEHTIAAVSPSDRLNAMTDVITGWAVRTAVTLELPDLVGEKPISAVELALITCADADALHRLLRYLSSRDFFHAEADDRFTGSELSALVRRDHPSGRRSWLDLDGMGGRNDRTAPYLLDAIRTGRPVYAALYGRAYWDDLAADPKLSSSFDALMATHGGWFDLVVDAVDWSGAGHVIDVGGGPGVLLSKVLLAQPAATGAVFDLPGPVAAASRTFADFGVGSRASVLEGSFADGVPAGADTYLLSNVLHDWSDADAEAILGRCAAVLPTQGRVIIAERLIDAAEDAQVTTRMDLRMLLLVGGKERTLADFELLAERAGLRMAAVHSTPAGISVLECVTAWRDNSALWSA